MRKKKGEKNGDNSHPAGHQETNIFLGRPGSSLKGVKDISYAMTLHSIIVASLKKVLIIETYYA